MHLTDAYKIRSLPEKPTMQMLLCFSTEKLNIAVQIGMKYFDFCIFLLDDTTAAIAKALENEYKLDAEQINKEIIHRWLEGKGLKPVAWSTLVAVLQKIGM